MTFDLLPSSQVNEVDHGCPGHALTCFIGRLLDEGDSNNSVSSTKKKQFSFNYHKKTQFYWQHAPKLLSTNDLIFNRTIKV